MHFWHSPLKHVNNAVSVCRETSTLLERVVGGFHSNIAFHYATKLAPNILARIVALLAFLIKINNKKLDQINSKQLMLTKYFT